MHRLSLLSAVLLLAIAGACKSTACCDGAGATALSAADRHAIESSSQVWLAAVRAADWPAVAATYTDDAVLMPPGAPIVSGRAAIQQFFATFPPIVSIDVADVDVDARGDLAYVRGTYRLAIAPPGAGTVRETGKFLEIRRRQADGRWLKSHDTFSADHAAQ